MLHSVAIAWDQLLAAFGNMESDRLFYFDRLTGEIFSIWADQDQSVQEQLEHHQGRFLEIPGIDSSTERDLLNSFLKGQQNAELTGLLQQALSGRPPYANPSDILSFFPDEALQLEELRDTFLSNRVKTWLEEHDLFSLSTTLHAVN